VDRHQGNRRRQRPDRRLLPHRDVLRGHQLRRHRLHRQPRRLVRPEPHRRGRQPSQPHRDLLRGRRPLRRHRRLGRLPVLHRYLGAGHPRAGQLHIRGPVLPRSRPLQGGGQQWQRLHLHGEVIRHVAQDHQGVGPGFLHGVGSLDASCKPFRERVAGQSSARVDRLAGLAILRRLDIQVPGEMSWQVTTSMTGAANLSHSRRWVCACLRDHCWATGRRSGSR